MNKIVASFGIVAFGASSIQIASAQGFDAPPSKLWNVTGTLRGFYDDNINAGPSSSKVDSFGFEISPGVGLNWVGDQTTVKLGYAYSLRYFDEERFDDAGHDFHSHTFNGALSHNFTERYSVAVQDSLTIGQEPDQLRPQLGGFGIGAVPGDNIRNYGSIVFNGALTPVFGVEVGYNNQWFDYDDDGGNALNPSFSGLLDRIEQIVRLEGQWHVMPQTTALLGYQFGMVDYTADESISIFSPYLMSEDRDNRSHYLYVGLNHRFQPDLTGSIQTGARFLDFYNVDQDQVVPYLRANLDYAYAPESTLGAGAAYDFTPAVQASARGSETASVFGNVRHRIVPNVFGSAIAQYQHSTYSGGTTDGDTEQLYTLGLNLEYQLNPMLSAHAGYNFDKVDSDAGFDYQRNRVYIGLTARY